MIEILETLKSDVENLHFAKLTDKEYWFNTKQASELAETIDEVIKEMENK